jgi:hypothetical protein
VHFFGYRSCESKVDDFRQYRTAQPSELNVRTDLALEPDGPGSRLFLMSVSDEYRVSWEAGRLPLHYEIFVDGADRKGVVEISRKMDGGLSIVARAVQAGMGFLATQAPSGGDGASATWAVRAREDNREGVAGNGHGDSPDRGIDPKLKIEMTTNAGKTWDPLFQEAPTGGAETWTITGPMRQNCRIRITTTGR